MSRNGDGWEGTGEDPYLVFALPEPRAVRAIRIRYAYERADLPAQFHLYWKRTDRDEFSEAERFFERELAATPGERTLVVPLNDTIAQFRIDPDTKPCVFRLVEIALLVAESAPGG